MLQVEDRRFPDDAQRPWHDCAYALYRLEFLQGPATLH
jgi:hypothetical protein